MLKEKKVEATHKKTNRKKQKRKFDKPLNKQDPNGKKTNPDHIRFYVSWASPTRITPRDCSVPSHRESYASLVVMPIRNRLQRGGYWAGPTL